MKMRLHTLLFATLLVSLVSCTDLEEELVGEITESLSVEYNGPVCDCGGGIEPAAFSYTTLRNIGTANHGGDFSLQELTSDEMVLPVRGEDWNHTASFIQLHRHTYGPDHPSLNNVFRALYDGIDRTNYVLHEWHYSPSDVDIAKTRVIRAYLHWRLLDLFGRVRIVTGEGENPPQSSRQEVFEFVEGELLDVLGVTELHPDMDLSGSLLPESSIAYEMNRYGALGILAKLYLNAEVYTGTPMYDKAEIAASYIIDSGHSLIAHYSPSRRHSLTRIRG